MARLFDLCWFEYDVIARRYSAAKTQRDSPHELLVLGLPCSSVPRPENRFERFGCSRRQPAASKKEGVDFDA
jgi:hypothetical protein